jgi:uncharacterized protein (TIGR03437 family)
MRHDARYHPLSYAVAWLVFLCHSLCGQQYSVYTAAGGGVPPSSIPAISAGFDAPYGVAADAVGNIYFSSGDRWVFRVDSNGILTRVAGIGTTGYSGDGGPAINAQLNGPVGLAIDSKRNLYIADTFNGRIRKVTPEGIITTVGGSTGVAGRGVAVDSADNLYVLSGVVRKVSTDGTVTTIVGDGLRNGYAGDGGPATSAELNNPQGGIACDAAGNLYIADTLNNRIRKVDRQGIITTYAGSSTAGSAGDGGPAANAQLVYPFGVAVDGSGNLFITEGFPPNYHVRKVSSGGTISTVSSLSFQGLGIAADRGGNVYFATGLLIKKLSPAGGESTTFAGNGGQSSSGDGGSATAASLAGPADVAVDAEGNLYIAEATGHRVRKVSPSGTITNLAGTGTAGFSGDGDQAAKAQLSSPKAVAVDSLHNVYVADTGNNRVRKIGADGKIGTVAGTDTVSSTGNLSAATNTRLISPQGVAVDSAQNVYIADTGNQQIRKLVPGGTISTVAGAYTQGFFGDGAKAVNALFFFPTAISVDNSGNLYILDFENYRIRKITASTGTIDTVAGNGTRNYPLDGGMAVNQGLYNAGGVSADSSGNFYIMDWSGVWRVSPRGIMTKLAAGNSLGGTLGDGGPAANATFSDPHGLAIDGSGNIFIADTGHDLVRVLKPVTPSVLVNVNAATYQPGPVSPDSFVTAAGQGLATVTLQATPPYPTSLGGTTVKVQDGLGVERLAAISYVSPGQVNYVLPSGAAIGSGTVTITSGSGSAATGPLVITAISPGLFLFSGTTLPAANVLRVDSRGVQTLEDVYAVGAAGQLVAKPINLGPVTDQVFLILYGTGIRGHSPNPNPVTVMVRGVPTLPTYAGPHSVFPGADQINLPLSRTLIGAGSVTIQLTVDGQSSNAAMVQVQ